MREPTDHVEVYQDNGEEYRWRRVASNGKTVADSAEGFVKKSYAKESAGKYNQDVEDIRDLTKKKDKTA